MGREPPAHAAEIELPALRPLGSFDFPLRRSLVPADGRPFTLAGDDAAIRLAAGDASISVRLGGADVLKEVGVEGGELETGFATPVGVERRVRVGDALAVERAVVPRAGPVAFLQWEGLPRGRVLCVLPRASGSEWRVLDRGLWLEGEPPVVLALSRGAVLDAQPGPQGLRVEVSLDGGTGLRLAVGRAAGGAYAASRLGRRMGRGHVAAAGRRAEARRVLEAGLVLETPRPELDEAIRWESVRLAGLVGERPVGAEETRAAVSALLIDRPARTRAVLDALAGTKQPGSPGLPALAGQYLAWTGDRSALRGHWQAIRIEAARMMEDGRAPQMLRPLAVAAEEMGDADLAERIRRTTSPGESRAADATEGAPAAGCAPDPGDPQLVQAVVLGLLGAQADAPRGRVRLRPRLPSDWRRFAVRSLPVGAAALDLSYERERGLHRFVVRQSRGGPPLQVVLEPELVGGEPGGAWVDGQPARLDAVPADGRWRVPVQFVLDHERRLDVAASDEHD